MLPMNEKKGLTGAVARSAVQFSPCDGCNGYGFKGYPQRTCEMCRGRGVVREVLTDGQVDDVPWTDFHAL